MKQIYKFSLILLGLTCLLSPLYGQGFTAKADKTIERYRSTSDYRKTISFADLFEFPEAIDVKNELSKNPEVKISFSSTDGNSLFFDGYYYSKWSGQFFYINIPKEKLGQHSLTVNIEYNGITASSKVIVNIIPVECRDDEYTINIGETKTLAVLKNDKPGSFLDKNTLKIHEAPKLGTLEITNEGEFIYTNNPETENYSLDSFSYRISDDLGNLDTGHVAVNIHKNSYVSKVFDFLPAPGQFVNTSWADTAAGKKLLGESSGGVSLGGFGGYIIVGFDQPIVNRKENPYGVDFTVVGNAFGGWGEPAAVQVMKDDNKNGLPDDTWYELAGSEYHFKASQKNLEMTYINPKYNKRKTIPYKTNKGFNGAMRTNGFHQQPYYPDPFAFGINIESVKYTGTLTQFLLDKSKPNYIVAKRLPMFGYADSRPANRKPTQPRNPYFEDENGKPADGFDLAWAVDSQGNTIKLDTVHFVKVYSTVQEDGGWLGEISPEIFKVAITTPVPDYKQKDYEFNAIGAAQLQVLKGTTVQYEGILFKNGIPQEATPQWSSDSTHIATVDNNGLLTAIETGTTKMRFSTKADVPMDSLEIQVVELKDVVIELEGNASTGNDTLFMINGTTEYIHAEALDNRKDGMNRFVYETYDWTTKNPEAGTIDNGLFQATAPGSTEVIARSTHNPKLADTITVIVDPIPEVTIIKDTLTFDYSQRQGQLNSNEIFSIKDDALIQIIKIESESQIIEAKIVDNRLCYQFKTGATGVATINFTTEAFGVIKKLKVHFEALPLPSEKNIVFVNGGEFQNVDAPTEIKTYLPGSGSTITLDNYLGGATSVQDMVVEGNIAYVSADYYITRYNVATQMATDSIYTQDKSPTEADGQGTEMHGVNHKLALYQNMLLATRQNSSSAPEDGYNVRIYNKGDLSLIKKIPVSDQATDIAVIKDTAYVIINGGFAGQKSSLAIIDLQNLSLVEELDLGSDGLGVMQVIAKEQKLYFVRLADYMGKYKSGVVVYDIASRKREVMEYASGIPYDSSPLAIEPGTNDTLFVKKDLGYVAFNTTAKTFGSDIFFPIPERFAQDLEHIAKGSVYDPDEQKYYLAYAYWHGDGVGEIYNRKGQSIGSFDGVGASPEVIKVMNVFKQNTAPQATVSATKLHIKEQVAFEDDIISTMFSDLEDITPQYYLHNPAAYPWLKCDPETGKLSGKYPEKINKQESTNSVANKTIRIALQAIDQQGSFALDTLDLIIEQDAPLIIANPLAMLEVEEDAPNQIIDLSSLFSDPDDDDNLITIRLSTNSNMELVTSSLSEKELTLAFTPNLSGNCQITITGELNGYTKEHTLNIQVSPVNDAPEVQTPLADITVDMNAPNEKVDISKVFTDIDGDILTLSIDDNTNPGLVSGTITNQQLTLSFGKNLYGDATITLKADDGKASVVAELKVTVRNTTSIDLTEPMVLKVYPNPCDKFITIESATVIKQIAIYNAQGKLVKISKPQAGNAPFTMAIDELPSGTYYIAIDGTEKRVTKTIVKQ